MKIVDSYTTSPRHGLRFFLTVYCGDDSYSGSDSYATVIADYLRDQSTDSDGSKLLSDIDELLARGMSEEQLRELFTNEWRIPVGTSEDQTWAAAISDIRAALIAATSNAK